MSPWLSAGTHSPRSLSAHSGVRQRGYCEQQRGTHPRRAAEAAVEFREDVTVRGWSSLSYLAFLSSDVMSLPYDSQHLVDIPPPIYFVHLTYRSHLMCVDTASPNLVTLDYR
ncbi:hypothetical protein TcCL_NonESM04742 [Trypanosoma cruzi]|nr:hypothetical protein TcCL_NonESM04742 [Trypanosoma cruzi]